MLPLDFLVVFLGLSAALLWGAGDFSGGLASKSVNVFVVVLIAQSVGILLLPILAYAFSEAFPPLEGIVWGGFAGLFAGIGLIVFYTALAKGKMGVVAPVSAIITVTVPVVYGTFNEGFPSFYQIAGFLFAVIGIWFVVSMNHETIPHLDDFKYPVLAGLCFGLFFICIDNFSETAIFWPLTVARISAIVILISFFLFTKDIRIPEKSILPLIIFSGLANVTGTVAFSLASQIGRLDVATVLSSLSTGVTVLLAWIILRQTLIRKQWFGVTMCLIAIILISV
ncbi:drug/metabolite transporter (DMT)-like permease [Methanohalophilus levihalophilus]|uniref:DMT family transporter n=1 Tax=Methanohalophilus levihalophilus TaxID=1431282 RepID=UPI001AE40115|nr:DMT family transporter [Methanohalophilus levihalophilus]MBP2031314.1 drug/metabolite transporter (DMT)-like permease [Methanohalophilus levihalophilus]